MKYNFLLLLTAIVILTSCNNKYKITQTPDDVYYSPIRGVDEKQEVKRNEHYSSSYCSCEDREMRMSRYDHRWNDFNDEYGYNYDPYHYGYNYGYYYNPYYYATPVYVYNMPNSNPKNTTPRTTNLSSYTFINTNPVTPQSGPVQLPRLGRDYNNSNFGNNIRTLFSSGSNGSESSNPRSYNPSSSGNSGSQSSGSSIVRPSRGRN